MIYADVIECAGASNYMCILLHVQQFIIRTVKDVDLFRNCTVERNMKILKAYILKFLSDFFKLPYFLRNMFFFF